MKRIHRKIVQSVILEISFGKIHLYCLNLKWLDHNQCSTLGFHKTSIDSGNLVWKKLKLMKFLSPFLKKEELVIVIKTQWS